MSEHTTQPDTDLFDQIAKAIDRPGEFVKRRVRINDYYEPPVQWEARAVLAVIGPEFNRLRAELAEVKERANADLRAIASEPIELDVLATSGCQCSPDCADDQRSA